MRTRPAYLKKGSLDIASRRQLQAQTPAPDALIIKKRPIPSAGLQQSTQQASAGAIFHYDFCRV